MWLVKNKDTKTTCKNYGWRDFRVFAPFLWNDLPVFIRQTESIDNFKKRLKTYLFVRHFRYSGTPLVRPPLLHQKSGLSRGVASRQG